MDFDVLGRIQRRPIRPRRSPFDAADEMLQAACSYPEIVAQRAFGPNSGIMAIALQFSDTAAGEVAGRADALFSVYDKRGVPRETVRKHRNCDERRVH